MRILGRYELIERLGRGGMGEVWRARDPALRRDVAVKVLRREGDGDATLRDDFVGRFLREARAAASLKHPCIVAIFDVGVDVEPYIVMEYVEGATLRTFIGDAKISVSQRLSWLVDIASGLDAAHAMGLVHRDIKPDNVMITKDGHAKVLDFGIAKAIDDLEHAPLSNPAAPESFRTQQGRIVGTPKYMAPEQMNGGTVDARADQWAWACVAYELLVGSVPDREELPAPISTALPEVPFDVAAGILRARSTDPTRRFDNMRELLDSIATPTLERAPIITSPSAAANRGPTAETSTGGARRRSSARAVLAAAAALLAGAAAFAFIRFRHEHVAARDLPPAASSCALTRLLPFGIPAFSSLHAAPTPVGLVASLHAMNFDTQAKSVALLTITTDEVSSRTVSMTHGLVPTESFLVATPEGAEHYIISGSGRDALVVSRWTIKSNDFASLTRVGPVDGYVPDRHMQGVSVALQPPETVFLVLGRNTHEDGSIGLAITAYGKDIIAPPLFTTTSPTELQPQSVTSRGNRVVYAFFFDGDLYLGTFTLARLHAHSSELVPMGMDLVGVEVSDALVRIVGKRAEAATVALAQDGAHVVWFGREDVRMRAATVRFTDAPDAGLDVGPTTMLPVTTDGSPPTLRFDGDRVAIAWRDGAHVWFGEGHNVEDAVARAGSVSDSHAVVGPWIGLSGSYWIAWGGDSELRRATATCK